MTPAVTAKVLAAAAAIGVALATPPRAQPTPRTAAPAATRRARPAPSKPRAIGV